MSIRFIAATVLAAGGLAVAGCGGEESSGAAEGGETTAKQRAQDAALKYAKCMREQGVDVPDPQVSEDGRITNRIPRQINRDEFREAQEQCRKHMKGAAGGREPSEEQKENMREQVLAYAECMRKEGVDFPDPQFQEGGGVIMGGKGLNPDDPDFRRAAQACDDKRPKGPGGEQ